MKSHWDKISQTWVLHIDCNVPIVFKIPQIGSMHEKMPQDIQRICTFEDMFDFTGRIISVSMSGDSKLWVSAHSPYVLYRSLTIMRLCGCRWNCRPPPPCYHSRPLWFRTASPFGITCCGGCIYREDGWLWRRESIDLCIASLPFSALASMHLKAIIWSLNKCYFDMCFFTCVLLIALKRSDIMSRKLFMEVRFLQGSHVMFLCSGATWHLDINIRHKMAWTHTHIRTHNVHWYG